jgi:tRNA threonylcarbamoyladenosine biosynthesis protein TsaE
MMIYCDWSLSATTMLRVFSETNKLIRKAVWLVSFVFLTTMQTVSAHPHVWIDGHLTLLFNGQGQVTALRHTWKFDELFSAFSLQGITREKNGVIPAAELKTLTDQWMLNLADPASHFFTTVSHGGQPIALKKPVHTQSNLDTQTNQLTLSFELPLIEPLALSKQSLEVDVNDPGYFVAFDYKVSQVLTLSEAPSTCRSSHMPPRPLDSKSQRQLGALTPDQKELPEHLRLLVRQLSHQFKVTC